MSIMTRIAADMLTERDWAVFEPGDKQIEIIGNHLAAVGYHVYQPNRLDMMASTLRRHGFVVHERPAQARQEALEGLRAEGWRLFAPNALPVSGLIYEPQRGTSAPRAVFPSETPGRVAYRNMLTGEDHSVALATWDRWMAQARAKVAE